MWNFVKTFLLSYFGNTWKLPTFTHFLSPMRDLAPFILLMVSSPVMSSFFGGFTRLKIHFHWTCKIWWVFWVWGNCIFAQRRGKKEESETIWSLLSWAAVSHNYYTINDHYQIQSIPALPSNPPPRKCCWAPQPASQRSSTWIHPSRWSGSSGNQHKIERMQRLRHFV